MVFLNWFSAQQFVFRVCLACLVTFTPLASAVAQSWLVIPGKQVGPITSISGRTALLRAFGHRNIRDRVLTLEAEPVRATLVFPGDTQRELTILWHKRHAKLVPLQIRIHGSLWSTAAGIHVGTSLKELESINGKPFELTGFGWDFGGTVTSCNGGTMSDLGNNTANGVQGRRLGLVLDPAPEWLGSPLYQLVLGDRFFSSSDSTMQTINPRVGEMLVDLE